ncbi:band 3 anion transport protein isoform X2 [Macrosteles quadrilineatus]|uniref:band 3 anion transport protein isoform X2 n=1 Tax=Macrosteles quadrilineatus TaxID=74068 RepID=UPI0023E31FBB|nr:band 3 anion transport protein isoform X2 [Macrosteles quadrilineatus]
MSFSRRSSTLARIGIKGDRDGAATETDLDKEMEKVFAMSDNERFNLASISNDPESLPDLRKFDEQDYSSHRGKNYPHIHMPLKIMHSRSMRKRTSSTRESHEGHEESEQRETAEDLDSPPALDITSSPSSSPEEVRAVSTNEPDESCRDDSPPPPPTPPLGDEPAAPTIELSEITETFSPDRRVQFDIDGLSDTPEESDARRRDKDMLEDSEKKRRKHRKHKKYSEEDPGWRKKSGAFLAVDNRRMSIQPEEAQNLQEVDQDDLTSHRFDVPRGIRRFSVKSRVSMASIGDTSRKSSMIPQTLPFYSYKKSFDHSPHKVFVQLNELIGYGEELGEWKETARWIKYEENLEEGAERWGKPHVATLSFHSLLNLRRCLETGVLLLDLEEKDLPGISYRIVEQMVVEELISPEDKPAVMRALLLRYRFVDAHERFRFSVRRNTSSYTSLQNIQEEVKSRPKMSIASSLEVPKMLNNYASLHDDPARASLVNHTAVEMKEETYMSSSEDLTKKAARESILKRIPDGAEAAAVLVGAVDFLKQPTTAFVRLAEGTMIPSITEVTIPVRFIFVLLGPPEADLDYHEIGRSISTLMSNSDFHTLVYKATERRDLLSAINEFLDFSIVLPPGDWDQQTLLPYSDIKEKTDEIRRRQSRIHPPTKQPLTPISERRTKYPDPLKRTRRPFGGLFNDIKRRYPWFLSDFKDGLNLQCFAAAIFIYFAALSAAIAFGGLMADKTNNLIGISETLVATASSGVFFALFGGQPLLIVGTTGPLLLFEESLYSFCQQNGIEYLIIRVYIGFWLLVIALIVSCFEGSVLVKLFTRFISEIFASLISLLYIVESAMKIYALFLRHPLMTLSEYCSEANVTSSMLSHAAWISNSSTNSSIEVVTRPVPATTNQPNTALFCTVLALGTFFIAYYLRHFRNSKFLGRSARRALGDFGVPIAIVLMVLLDYVEPGVYTEKLKVPEGLSPSNPSVRGWLISPLGLLAPVPLWVAGVAVVPAMLVYILLFMETHISELIIDKKERKLKKGCGFHLDIVLVCIANVGCGLMGAPYMCVATVRSVAHVSAVTVMSRTHAPGDKPHIIEVKEQRLSALAVSILVGVSVLFSPLLRLVPMAALFGVFLYMGISSIDGIQFFERLILFFMPVKHHPQVEYVRRVQTMKMHLFTLIQLACLAGLWVIKSSPLSLAFPFFIILIVPLRAQFRYLFTEQELKALDSDGPADQIAQEDEPDFYAESLLAG